MKKIFSMIMAAMVFGGLSVSCEGPKVDGPEKDSQYLESFMKLGAPCVYIGGEEIGRFDKTTDQVVMNSSKSEYMVASGTGDKFYSLYLNGEFIIGDTVMVSAENYGYEKVDFENLMTVVKADSLDNVYLWNNSKEVGFVIANK